MVGVLRYLQRFIPAIAIGFLLLALVLARKQFTSYHISHIHDLVLSVPSAALVQAGLFMLLGYFTATFYDRVALRYLGKALSFRKTILAAFISFAVSHNAGHPLVSGSSIRYRFYPNWGLTGIEIIKIVLVDSITYGLGLCSLLMLAYGLMQGYPDSPLPLPALNAIIVMTALAYMGYCLCILWWRPVLTLKGVRFQFPDSHLTLAQIAIGSVDVFCSGMVLHTLLSSMLPIPLGDFFIIYVISLILGTFSQLPGGLGVFEGAFLHLLSSQYPDADVLAALVLYRIIYYFIPLAIAGILLLAYELKTQHISLRRLTMNTFKRHYHH